MTKKKVPRLLCCVVVCVLFFLLLLLFDFFLFFWRETRRVSFIFLSFLFLPFLRVCSSAGVEEEPFLNLPHEEEEEKKRVRSSCRRVLLDERL